MAAERTTTAYGEPVERYDVAVIGLGGIGSATTWYAARSGRSVIGLERFELGGHARGASHDHSRIIRHSYHTAHYVELTRHAYACWRDVEQASGEQCVHVTSGIDLFPRGAAIDIDTYRRAMRANDLTFTELSAGETMDRWPAWHLAEDVQVLYQENTGIVSPAHTVPLLQRLAASRGATLRGECSVVAIEPADDRVVVHLDDGHSIQAVAVVLASDAWTTPLLEPLGLPLPLTVTKEQVTYYATESPAAFERSRFPVWIWMDDPSFYGFPSFGVPGVKIAQDCGGRPVDPTHRDFAPDPDILGRTNAFAAGMFDGRLGAPLATTTCLYTLTPDRDFVVDSLPGLPSVHIGLGAGHGYKFVAWFGRTLAALAIGNDPACDLKPFRLDRPALTDPAWEPNWLV
jgi:sarcosine oxidase